ncbi:MAG: hypothetical protein IKO73_06675 [Bacteroidaceae bacterium]|nr:hypothetical protein [Bacteroidaceae bacterium]
MKHTYNKPAIVVVKLQAMSILCESTPEVTETASNADLYFVGGTSTITVRTRESVWEEEW